MNIRPYLNLTFSGFVIYLILLGIVCVVYVRSEIEPEDINLTGVSLAMQKDNTLAFSVRGQGLGRDVSGFLALDAANHNAIVASLPVWGQAIDAMVVGQKLYVVKLNEGARSYDLTVPIAPEAGISFGKRPWDVTADADRIYLSDLTSGISVYNAAKNMSLYQIDSKGTSFKSVLHRGHLFVAEGEGGLSIYDVTGEGPPQHLITMPLPGVAVDLAVNSNRLFVACGASGLHVIALNDITHPRLIQTIAPRKHYDRVNIFNNVVYASDSDKMLDVFGLSPQHKLMLQSSLPLLGLVKDIVSDGSRIYLSEASYGVSVLDIKDPLHPERDGYVGTPGETAGLALYDQYLYVACRTQGVKIVDTRLLARRDLPALNTPGRTESLLFDGRWMYVTDGPDGFKVIDRSDIDNLQVAARVKTEFAAIHLAKSGDILFVSQLLGDLLLFDVHSPLEPRLISRLRLENDISDMLVRGTDLFTISLSGKLLRIEFADPQHPMVAETLDLPDRALRIDLKDNDIYVAGMHAGLLVVRFEPGMSGRIISQLVRPWPMSEFVSALGVAVLGDFAYVVQGTEGLQIVDISDPQQPEEVAFVKIPGQNLDIVLSGQYAILSNRWLGYFFVDIQQPDKARLVANIFQPRVKTGFQVENGLLYSPSVSSGISVIPLPQKHIARQSRTDLTMTFAKPEYPGRYDLYLSDGRELLKEASVVEIE